MSPKHRLATFLCSVVLYTIRKALPRINLTNKLRLSKWNSVGLQLETSLPVSIERKGEGGAGGKPGLLFFTSEVCSLQAASALQMPFLPSPYLHPLSCNPAQPRWMISLSAILPFPLSVPH